MTVETGIDGMYARLNDTNHKTPQTKLADANYSELGGVSIASNLVFETVLLFCFILQAQLLCNEGFIPFLIGIISTLLKLVLKLLLNIIILLQTFCNYKAVI